MRTDLFVVVGRTMREDSVVPINLDKPTLLNQISDHQR
jgi:hypothetical protein